MITEDEIGQPCSNCKRIIKAKTILTANRTSNVGRRRSADYEKIREARAAGNKIAQIAAEFNTSETTVLRALKVK